VAELRRSGLPATFDLTEADDRVCMTITVPQGGTLDPSRNKPTGSPQAEASESS